MSILKYLTTRLLGLLRRNAVLDDIDREMRAHIDLVAQANIDRGVPPDEAREAAARSFGNLAGYRDLAHDVRGGGLLETLVLDARFGARVLRKNLGFTTVAVLTLALGIGATTAIFSVVDAVLLKPLPFKDADRLVMIKEKKPPTFPEFSVAPGNFLDWRAQSQSFEPLVAFKFSLTNLAGDGDPERLLNLSVTEGFDEMLGVEPELGRGFAPEENQVGKNAVAIISHGLWERRFGSDPGVVGRTLTLDDKPYTVVGVMPAGFSFLSEDIEMWTPIAFTLEDVQNHGGHSYGAVGRLKPGVTADQAQTELAAIASRLEQQYPDSNAGWGVKSGPMLDFIVGDMRGALLLLLGAVGFVLLIACANVANLLLARAAGRHKEVAVRVALGASRWRVVRQLLTESVILAAAGGLVGVAFAKLSMMLILRLAPEGLARLEEATIDARVLVFAGAITLLTAVVFGLVPAFQASKTDPNEAMKEAGRGSTEGGRKQLVGGGLVVLEIASALVLLVGAGLLVRSFSKLENVNPGFDPDGTFTASVDLPRTRYSEDPQRVAFFGPLVDRVRAMPGVTSAAACSNLPLSGSDILFEFVVQGQPPSPSSPTPITNFYAVSDGYFETMRIPIKAGRPIDARDTKDSRHVAVVNETLIERIFPNQDPIGQRITFDDPADPTADWFEIVGVVGDVKEYGLDKAPTMQTYEPFTQQTMSSMTVVARADGDPSALAGPFRSVVTELDKQQPVTAIGTLDRSITRSVNRQEFSTFLLGVFAAAALLLAAIGIYGLLNYTVAQRTHEIGIRMALGAGRRDVLKFVVGRGLALALVGVALGCFVALGLARLISGMLFGVSASDPLTFASIVLILVGVALVACLVPALRAAKVDPLVALRHD